MKVFRVCLVITLSAACAIAQDARLAFDTVSIEPNTSGGNNSKASFSTPDGRFAATNTSLDGLITRAYGVNDYQIEAGPAWMLSVRYDIEAISTSSSTGAEMRLMLRTLLEDRFHLRLHRETRERPICGLVPSKNVGKLRPSERAGADKDHYEPGLVTAEALSLPQLAGVLSRLTGHRVVDNTGMAGRFQIRLQFTKDTLFTAVEEQLGLRLELLSTELLDVLVIDQAQQPSEN